MIDSNEYDEREPSPERMRVFTLYLTESYKTLLKIDAKLNNTSCSQIIRDLLKQRYERYLSSIKTWKRKNE